MQLAIVIFVLGQKIAPFAVSKTNTAHALRGFLVQCWVVLYLWSLA